MVSDTSPPVDLMLFIEKYIRNPRVGEIDFSRVRLCVCVCERESEIESERKSDFSICDGRLDLTPSTPLSFLHRRIHLRVRGVFYTVEYVRE